MWIAFAFLSAFFAGITAILAKCGIKTTGSDIATAVRTIVVLICAWIIVFIVGSQNSLGNISGYTWLFLILSGLSTGASWLCYFRALQLGDVNKVVPIDKSSIVLTIILSCVILGESVTWLKTICAAAIAAGTYLMIVPKKSSGTGIKKTGLIYALLSAVFACLTTILGKIGITGVESNLGTAIRTGVVLVMAWVIVFVKGEHKNIVKIPRKELLFIILSGIATSASWLCYFRALQDGDAGIVAPIDKLSILVSIAFSFIVFKERLTKKGVIGLGLIVAGTLCMLI